MVSTISLLNEDFDHHACDHQLKRQTDERQSDEFYSIVQGDKVTAHNTSHLAESQHLEWEDCDLAYIHIGGGTMGGTGGRPHMFHFVGAVPPQVFL